MRQPLGVVAGITPFNFPAMIPLWKYGPAIACGNAFILKPSERDPGVPMMLAELAWRPACRRASSTSSTATRRRSTPSSTIPTSRPSASSARPPSPSTSIARLRGNGKRVQCFGGAKNHMIIMPDADMDQAVDALIGAGYGSAGERCMAISVAVPVGEKTADALVAKLKPRVEALKIGPSTDGRADFGPLVTKAHRDKVKGYVDSASRKAPSSSSTAAASRCRATRTASIIGGCLFDHVTPT
jgi:malonate-semialdehyde dehydrogenase (acetylating)/methylmalonate-semialdehyde dehydrogenase